VIVEKYAEFDPNFECSIVPDFQFREEHSHFSKMFSIFNLDVPLGEILYEENEIDDNLKNINKNPEFICFVNRAMSSTFDEFGFNQDGKAYID
tara:strand:- start:1504 stop:1782 length:279 start_codon:yes stop_codon:yes gene_type:complete